MRIACAALLLAVGLGCGGSETPARERVQVNVEDPERYRVSLDGPARLAAGSGGDLRLAVEPLGPFKLAVEYPLRMEVADAAGLAVAPTRQAAADAARYDAEGCAFDFGVEALEPGSRRVKATVHFGICETDLCEPVTRRIDFGLQVD